ncbi:MAG: TauD/TfdA family dioxygenase [Gammaproteobacteria bacterium]|nr:TauD/TfdA family dioxygenase [Gammaproteobacteria bacterium]
MQIQAMSRVGGVRVDGLDIRAPLDDAIVQRLEQLLLDEGVLLFPGQPLSARQLADFAACFGTVQPHVQRAYQHPEVPEVVYMTNRKADGSFDLAGASRGAARDTRDGWHSDLSYDPRPAKATLLHALQVPDHGGNTCFSNVHLAWRSLPLEVKRALTGRQADFVYGGHSKNQGAAIAASALDNEARRTARAVHPVINAHVRSGRPAIYANPLLATRILDVPEAESERLLQLLFDAIDANDWRFEHRWSVGDTLLWDNRGGIMHTGRLDYPLDQARVFIRTTVSGGPILPFDGDPD